MNYQNKPVFIAVISASLMLPMVGCASKERVVTYDVTKSGKNWAESQSVQERRGPGGRVTVDKQSVYEKVQCVDRKGRKIKASSADECIDLGGRVIDEMRIEEQTIKNR